MIDYETDPRPLADCLRDFALQINGGTAYRSRERAAAELRVCLPTYIGWAAGRKCQQERAIRRLMTMIVNSERPEAA